MMRWLKCLIFGHKWVNLGIRRSYTKPYRLLCKERCVLCDRVKEGAI